MAPEKAGEILKGLNPEFVSISGGDPLAHPDFYKIAEAVGKVAEFEVLTSGLLVKEPERMKGMSVQVTIDGTEEYHNSMRGQYGGVIEGARKLGRHANLTVVTVLTDGNWKHIPEIARLSQDLGAKAYRVIRMLPVRPELRKLAVSKAHALEVARKLRELRKELDMEITAFWLDALLKFEESGAYGGTCGAGRFKLVVRPDGAITPCEFLRSGVRAPFQNFLGCPAMTKHMEGFIGNEGWFMPDVRNLSPRGRDGACR